MLRPARDLAVLFAAATFVVLVSACGSPKAGGSCKVDGKTFCESKTAGLVCASGKWEPVKCKGAKGCAPVGDGECDQSLADDGDACDVESDHACSSDKKSVVACKGRKWSKVTACPGPAGCERVDKDVKCDNSFASAGDACAVEKDYACAADKKSTLVCKGGKFEAGTPCKGPKACGVSPGKVHCDDTIADLGDPCEKKGDGDKYACASDAKTVLKCDGQKFVLQEKCKGKDTCKVLPEGVGCGG